MLEGELYYEELLQRMTVLWILRPRVGLVSWSHFASAAFRETGANAMGWKVLIDEAQ